MTLKKKWPLLVVLSYLLSSLFLILVICALYRIEESYPFDDPLSDLSPEEKAKTITERAISAFDRKSDCERPVLRGTPIPGSAGQDIIDALVVGYENEECHRLLSDVFPLRQKPVIVNRFSPGFPPKKTYNYVGNAIASMDAAAIAKLNDACEWTFGKIASALRHEEACCPFPPHLPSDADTYVDNLNRYNNLMSYHALVSRNKAKEEDLAGALEILNDGVLFSQDIYREGKRPVNLYCSILMENELLEEIELLLNRKKTIPVEILRQFIEEARKIQVSRPPLRSVLEGWAETLFSNLSFVWDEEEECWVNVEEETETNDAEAEEKEGCAPLKEVYLLLWMYHFSTSVFEELCPEGSREADCIIELKKYYREVEEWEAWRGQTDIPFFLMKRFRGEEGYYGAMERILAPDLYYGGFTHCLKERSYNRFRLQALMVLAAYRIEKEKTGACPGEEIFEKEEIEELLVDPDTKEKIRIKRLAKGKYILMPSMILETEIKLPEREYPMIYIDCQR